MEEIPEREEEEGETESDGIDETPNLRASNLMLSEAILGGGPLDTRLRETHTAHSTPGAAGGVEMEENYQGARPKTVRWNLNGQDRQPPSTRIRTLEGTMEEVLRSYEERMREFQSDTQEQINGIMDEINDIKSEEKAKKFSSNIHDWSDDEEQPLQEKRNANPFNILAFPPHP